ncbi:Swi5-domain-containing protein [Pyronema omphalodes]|nr:Swi5-domain-containing protein [Pyronema omphalodes]
MASPNNPIDSPSFEINPPSSSIPSTPHDKKLATLHAQNSTLETQLTDLKRSYEESLLRLKNPENKGVDTVKRHIRLLHEYNEVRDVALGLVGLVAEARGVPVGEVLRECGIEEVEKD